MKVAPRYTLFTLFKLLYTALNVACMPIYILLEKVKTLLEEWANELLSKMLDGLEWILVSEMTFSSLSVRALPVLEMKI